MKKCKIKILINYDITAQNLPFPQIKVVENVKKIFQ